MEKKILTSVDHKRPICGYLPLLPSPVLSDLSHVCAYVFTRGARVCRVCETHPPINENLSVSQSLMAWRGWMVQ